MALDHHEVYRTQIFDTRGVKGDHDATVSDVHESSCSANVHVRPSDSRLVPLSQRRKLALALGVALGSRGLFQAHCHWVLCKADFFGARLASLHIPASTADQAKARKRGAEDREAGGFGNCC